MMYMIKWSCLTFHCDYGEMESSYIGLAYNEVIGHSLVEWFFFPIPNYAALLVVKQCGCVQWLSAVLRQLLPPPSVNEPGR